MQVSAAYPIPFLRASVGGLLLVGGACSSSLSCSGEMRQASRASIISRLDMDRSWNLLLIWKSDSELFHYCSYKLVAFFWFLE